jgi:hypothetical protein
VVYGIDSSDCEQGKVAGSCENSNEPLGPTKYWKFLSSTVIVGKESGKIVKSFTVRLFMK